MGVNTKAWGPLAWILLHALAKRLDERLRRLRGSRKRREAVRRQGVLMFTLLKDILPCVHCRRSYTVFTTQRDTSVARAGSRGLSFRLYMYRIHEKVNKKLFWQSVAQADTWRWLGYQPSLGNVTYVDLDSPEALAVLFRFTTYVYCDVDTARLAALRSFPRIFGRLLVSLDVSYASMWLSRWRQLQNSRRGSRTLSERLRDIGGVHKECSLDAFGVVPDMDPDERGACCRQAIVGC